MGYQAADDGDRETERRVSLSPVVSIAIVGIFILLLIGALYYARSFVLPFVLACLLGLTVAPLVRWLARHRIPSIVSSVLLIAVIGTAIGGTSMMLSTPVAQMAERMPVVVAELRDRFAFLRRPVATLNNAGREVEAMLQGPAQPDTEKVVVADQGQGVIGWALGTLADLGTTLVATLLLAPFLLTATDAFRHKIVRVLPALSDKKRSLYVLNDIESEVSRYLVTVTAINAGLGLCVAAMMAILGMGTPYAWGAAAALLNYIPYVGPSIGVMLVGASSLATHGAWASALLPPLAYLGLQILEGAFVTPTILGRRLELSPIAILGTLALTTWMWGIVGTVIGVPLLVVVKVFCDRFPSLAPIGVFIAAEAPPADEPDEEPAPRPAVAAVPEPATLSATGRAPNRAIG